LIILLFVFSLGNSTGFLIFGGKITDKVYASDIWLFRYECKMWIRLNDASLSGKI